MNRTASPAPRLLVVEDDPDQRFLLGRTLTSEYGDTTELLTAESLNEALTTLRSGDPDCIVVDLGLPDASGVAAVERLREETSAAIVVVTGHEDLGVESLLAGAQDFLLKGYDSGSRLREAIDGALARSAAVREQEHLAAIVKSSPHAMFVRGLDGTVLTWNDAAEATYGYSREEIVGKHYFTFVPESQRATEAQITEFLMVAGRKIAPYEATRVRKDGSIIDVAVTATPITDESDHVVGISHIALDITKESELRRERDLLAAIVNSSLGAIVSINADGIITSWNQGAERLFGYTADEAIGRSSTLLAPPDRQIESREFDTRLIAGEDIVDVETVRADKDGRHIDVSITANPIKDRDGNTIGVAAIYHDMTEHKHLEAQLLQSQKMEALGGLAGGIAHDFNNLLAVILNYGRFVQADLPDDHPAREDVQEIVQAAERGATLVRQLLSFARREVVCPEPINLNLLITQMEPLLKRAISAGINLESHLAESLWATEADRGQMEQLLLNLVVNARDAMPEGGRILIETRNIEADEAFVAGRSPMEPGNYVALLISDTGTGMDKETQARIFEPFFTTKPRGSGTGLGLSSVYGIVQRAGGDISVYSERGIGTVFKIFLPASEVFVELPTPAPGDPKYLAGRGERILVVEDESPVLELIERILTNAGYDPIAVSSPQDALDYLKDHRDIELLLTDVIMPEMSGRALAETSSLTPVFMSGYTDSVILQQGVIQEGVVFLPKPFSATELLKVVRTTLDSQHIDLTETQNLAS